MKHKDCEWCGEKLFKCREHKCPRIFIHEINQDGKRTEIIMRGEIELQWKGRKVIIFENKERKVGGKRK